MSIQERVRGNEKLTSFLASFSVRVLLAAHDDGVYGDENSQHASQYGLDNDENNTSYGLSCLCDTKLFNEDQNAYN